MVATMLLTLLTIATNPWQFGGEQTTTSQQRGSTSLVSVAGENSVEVGSCSHQITLFDFGVERTFQIAVNPQPPYYGYPQPWTWENDDTTTFDWGSVYQILDRSTTYTRTVSGYSLPAYHQGETFLYTNRVQKNKSFYREDPLSTKWIARGRTTDFGVYPGLVITEFDGASSDL